MDTFSGHFLCSEHGTDSQYCSLPVTVRPGSSLNIEEQSGKKILLAGGFNTIQPDAAIPLSPTLQLNGDLTNTDDTRMAALAQAEFIRCNSQSLKSFTLEPDSRLTVLGEDAAAIRAFVDTYGGVLQIDPILTRGYDTEFTTAQELRLEKSNDTFRISFTVKQPVDLNKCTYCGACGPVCPEHCLSEQLFLDFSHCSFCKECVSACSHDAIDLYGVEKRELVTPAILLLGETSIDLPEQKKNIYSVDTLAAFFAGIYATEVEEVITWDSSICQYSAKLGTGCTLCFSSCQHDAVKQNREGVQIDHLACVECGACLGVCPTGALHYKRFEDESFVEFFKTAPLAAGKTVVLGDEQELHKLWWYSPEIHHEDIFFMEYPNTTALHSMHFLLLYGMGAKRILVLKQENNKQNAQIEFTNSLLMQLFQQDSLVTLVQADKINSVLTEESPSNSLPELYRDFSYGNRRQKLIELIQFLRQQSDTSSATLAAKDFGEVICDEEKCTQCVACVNECRTKALVADNDSFSLKHTPANCVQCGICVTVCPENALTLQSGLNVNNAFFTERVLSQAEPARCKGCGKIFGTQKSLEKVMAILSAKSLWDSDDDLLSYCENCRVVNLYESSEKQV